MSLLQEIKVFKEIANDEFSTVVKLYFRNGDKVRPGDPVVDLSTSKAVFAINAEKEGYIENLCREGEDVPIGAVIIKIYDNPSDIISCSQATDRADRPESVFSKRALEIIEKEGIDKSIFYGRDMVSANDVLKLTGKFARSAGSPKSSEGTENVTLKPLDPLKKYEISSLSEVQSSGMDCVAAVHVDIEGLMRFSEENSAIFKDSILHYIIFESARLLEKYPELNAYYDGDNIAYYRSVDIGLAVDLGEGLKVVKLPMTDKKTALEIESGILEAANKYLDKKLTSEDISGSTFTVTDLSREGIDFFTPLINRKQSSILGISSLDKKFGRMTVSLTFDHRVTEGKKAAGFLRELKERLEGYGQAQPAQPAVYAPLDMRCGNCLATLEDIKNLDGTGLLRIVDCDGNERLICKTCFMGWI